MNQKTKHRLIFVEKQTHHSCRASVPRITMTSVLRSWCIIVTAMGV
jgi:hypothetical protein